MQFSKKVSENARLFGVDPKDVLFAMLITAGASHAESFAVIYRPTISTSSALTTKASNYINQRPGLKKLINKLAEDLQKVYGSDSSIDTPKRGRPRKTQNTETISKVSPSIDYTDKDAILKELAVIAERCEKESDRLAALREISALQRMKNEAKIEEEKRVNFYIPLSFDRCQELLSYLHRYFEDKKD